MVIKINIYNILFYCFIVLLGAYATIIFCDMVLFFRNSKNKRNEIKSGVQYEEIDKKQYNNDFTSYSEYKFDVNDIRNVRRYDEVNELCVKLSNKTREDFKIDDLMVYNGLISLYSALICYLKETCREEDFSFDAIIFMLDSTGREEFQEVISAIDLMFEQQEEDIKNSCKPYDSFAIRQYNIFKQLSFSQRKDIIFMASFSINKILVDLNKFNLDLPEPKKAEIIDVSFFREPIELDSDEKKTLTQEEINQAIERVSISGLELEVLSPELQDNEDVVISAINNSGWAIKWVSERLRDDEDVIMASVSKWGYSLAFASNRLRDNEEFVIKACKHNGYALAFASPRLRDNGKIVSVALKEKGRSLRHASVRLRKSEFIVNCALTTSKRAKDFSLLS